MATAHRLTVRKIEAAPTASKLYRLPDGAGLYLAVHPTGTKTFQWRYKDHGRERWMTLDDAGADTFPALSLARARELVAHHRAARNAGVDPLEVKRAEKIERKQQVSARIAAAEAALARPTVAQLFERWLAAELGGRKDQGAEVSRCFRKDVLPLIGALPVEAVTKADVMRVLDQLLARGVKRMAKRCLSDLRQMFGYALDRELIAADPTARIKKDRLGGKEVMRERHLSEEEIRALLQKLPDAKLPVRTEAALWIMLATCCRVGEISQARWEDLDLRAGTWTIPLEHAKNGRKFVIHLSPFAQIQFQRLAELRAHDDWMLPNRAGDGPIDKKAIAKQVHDRQCAKPLRKRSKKNTTLELPGGPWTPHDLRRTGATLMGNLGVMPYVIERCLNHIEPNKLVRTYQHQQLVNEQRAAWSLLGDRLSLLTVGGNVVPLPTRAA
jgi:integrase